MSDELKEILTRAAWTVLECFVASLPFTAEIIRGMYAVALSGLISLLAGALSAIKTIYVQTWKKM